MLRAGALVGLGAAIASLTGCGLFGRDDPDPRPDPLEPLVTNALALASRYQTVIAATPGLADRLTPIAEAHQAHATELAAVIGLTLPSPSSSPPTSGPTLDEASVLAELRAAEEQAHTEAVTACTQAPADRVALVGSIAAARATHLEVLR